MLDNNSRGDVPATADAACAPHSPTPPSAPCPPPGIFGGGGGGGCGGGCSRWCSFMLQQADCDDVLAMLTRTLASNLQAASDGRQQPLHPAASEPTSNKSGIWDSSSLDRSTDRMGSMNLGGGGHACETALRSSSSSSFPNFQKATAGGGTTRVGLLPDIHHSPNSPPTPTHAILQPPPSSPSASSRMRRLSRTQDPSFSSFLERAGPFVFDRPGEGDAEGIVEGAVEESPFTATEKALTRLRSFSVKDRSPAAVAAAARGVHYSALEEAVASQKESTWAPIGAGSEQYRHYRVNK